MKVLHIITGLGVGGAERQLRLLLRHLTADCEVVTLTNPGPLADAIREDGVPVTHLGMRGNRDLSALPRLTSLIRSGRYDLVHTHLYRACVYGRPAARLAGVRAVVATEHSLGATQIEGRPLSFGTRALYRATERLGKGTLAVSPTVAHRLDEWGVPSPRVHLVPNGVEPSHLRFDPAVRAETRDRLGIPRDAFVVGGVGRQVPGKNFDTLIRAVAGSPDTHLLLVGDGPERFGLLRLIHQLRLASRVHLTEGEVPGLLAAMDLFVSLSTEEAFGVAVVEALAAGLPALYTACPAVEDLASEEAPGARRITREELAAVLREERLAGPRRLPVPAAVERYDIARTAERVMALYAQATERRRWFRRTPAASAAGASAGALPAARDAQQNGAVPAPAAPSASASVAAQATGPAASAAPAEK
ncbi:MULTISPECIES: glycosyltransferase [unclassified Streptomyces]|uniref:glycosyltransferase n=1 Tax=unclassified Streptomyces TaxID=2593676 RepID=UPI002E2AD432|nr:glycosyltransferase [Streptomyces sp. NBC_00223]